MSVHDRAAANYARRFTLTVTRYAHGCMQTFEFDRLTQSGVEAEKKHQQETLPPGYEQWFDVSSC